MIHPTRVFTQRGFFALHARSSSVMAAHRPSTLAHCHAHITLSDSPSLTLLTLHTAVMWTIWAAIACPQGSVVTVALNPGWHTLSVRLCGRECDRRVNMSVTVAASTCSNATFKSQATTPRARRQTQPDTLAPTAEPTASHSSSSSTPFNNAITVPALVILVLIMIAMSAYGWWNGLLFRNCGALSRNNYQALSIASYSGDPRDQGDDSEGWGDDDDDDEVVDTVEEVQADDDALVLTEDDGASELHRR
jgi:hypothetical protein